MAFVHIPADHIDSPECSEDCGSSSMSIMHGCSKGVWNPSPHESTCGHCMSQDPLAQTEAAVPSCLETLSAWSRHETHAYLYNYLTALKPMQISRLMWQL